MPQLGKRLAQCAKCKRPIYTTQLGVMRTHVNLRGWRCPGSGKYPLGTPKIPNPGKGECRTCGKFVQLTQYGLTREHRPNGKKSARPTIGDGEPNVIFDWSTCSGSSKPPAENLPKPENVQYVQYSTKFPAVSGVTVKDPVTHRFSLIAEELE